MAGVVGVSHELTEQQRGVVQIARVGIVLLERVDQDEAVVVGVLVQVFGHGVHVFVVGETAASAHHGQNDVIGLDLAEEDQEVVPVIELIELGFDRILGVDGADAFQRVGGGVEDDFGVGVAAHVPHFQHPQSESELIFGTFRDEYQQALGGRKGLDGLIYKCGDVVPGQDGFGGGAGEM